MRILDRFPRLIPCEQEIGIEIEMEGSNLYNYRSRFWVNKKEYSLRGREDQQVEYVSSPLNRNEYKRRIINFHNAHLLRGAVFTPSDRCGVHVHINCQQMTENQVILFTCLYLVFEKRLLRFCGESRESNLFCLSSDYAQGFLDALLKAYISQELKILCSDRYRYSSINLKSLATFGTVEFRGFPTEPKWTRLLTWIEMLLSLKDKSLQYTTIKQIIEDFSGQGVQSFIESVFKDNTHLIINPPGDCYHELLEGIRHIQDIAYAQPIKGID